MQLSDQIKYKDLFGETERILSYSTSSASRALEWHQEALMTASVSVSSQNVPCRRKSQELAGRQK